jgi:hypothetical protein
MEKLSVSAALFLATLTLGASPTAGQTVRICVGQYESRCAPHDLHLECGADVEEKAREICRRRDNQRQPDYNIVKGADLPGNRCGYASFLVVCRGDAPASPPDLQQK